MHLAGCSSHWRASIELRQVPVEMQPLQVKLKSELGDELNSSVAGGCVEVSIWQSSKLSNHIAVTVADRDGKVLGRAQTNDLANRPFTIALDGGGQVQITPGKRCERRWLRI